MRATIRREAIHSGWIAFYLLLSMVVAPTRVVAQPIPLPTIGLLCGDGRVELGEDCDPPGSQCPNAATGIKCSASCTCACPNTIEFTGTSTGGVLDTGWTGIAHDSTVISDGTVTVDVTSCAGSSRPCGICSFAGPIANAGAADYTAGTGTQINDHRCTGNTRTTCATTADCSVAGGTCEFYFGTLLPLSAGGVSTCVENRFNGTFSGTANIETGTSQSSPHLTSRVFSGATNPHPCPRCLGDAVANDGVRGGTCDIGTDAGQPCDINGLSPNENFGDTSLDCRPSTSVIAALPIDLTNTTGTATKTLTTANPFCRATGHTTSKCQCDTCDNSAATPCSTNADCRQTCAGGTNANTACTTASQCPGGACRGGTTCGGKRCQLGTNAGASCAVASECPSGSCGVPGLATAPNQCDGGDLDCAPGGTPGPNDGQCQTGPTDFSCQPNGTMIGCTSDADCAAAGVMSCVGGTNAGHVCSVASECPGGSCNAELCTGVKQRECFLDNGVTSTVCEGGTKNGTACTTASQCPGGVCGGASDKASGQAVVPVNDASDPTLAALFCIGPTSSSSVNAAAGLPGLGRLELQGHTQGTP